MGGGLLQKLLPDDTINEKLQGSFNKEFNLNIDMLVDIKRDVNHQNPHNSSQAKSMDDQLPVVPENEHNSKRSVASLEPIIAVVVIACNRPDYIRQTLDNLLK